MVGIYEEVAILRPILLDPQNRRYRLLISQQFVSDCLSRLKPRCFEVPGLLVDPN